MRAFAPRAFVLPSCSRGPTPARPLDTAPPSRVSRSPYNSGGMSVMRASAVVVVLLTASGVALVQRAAPPASLTNDTITAIPEIAVGHHTLAERPTGCTVVLVGGNGAIGAVSVRGGAPGTRETDLLAPDNTVQQVNAIVFAGGSAFGLDAAGGVMRFLEEKHVGYATTAGPVPIVPAAILFDLNVGA